MSDLRSELRAVPSVTGAAEVLPPSQMPDDPRELFVAWLREAIGSGVREPLAMTLSTVDGTGAPDARVLILKDVTDEGAYEIATHEDSAKAHQLAEYPRCALSVYWSQLARAVRVRGVAERATRAESAADFLARHPDARAGVLASAQGVTIDDDDAYLRRLAEARRRVEADPTIVASEWVVWRVRPVSIEFWQGSPTRSHVRALYERDGVDWTHRRISA